MIPRKGLVSNPNHKEPLFCRDVFAINRLEDEFALCHLRAYGIYKNSRFLEQLAAGSVSKALSFLHSTTRRRPIGPTGERSAAVHESEQQHPILWIDDK